VNLTEADVILLKGTRPVQRLWCVTPRSTEGG